MRDPYRRLWDPRYQRCGLWGCCADVYEVRDLLEVVAHHLPPRDAHRFRSAVAEMDERW